MVTLAETAAAPCLPSHVTKALLPDTLGQAAFTHWNGEVEISQCINTIDGTVEIIGPDATEQDKAESFWSVYLRQMRGGVQCVADLRTEAEATAFGAALHVYWTFLHPSEESSYDDAVYGDAVQMRLLAARSSPFNISKPGYGTIRVLAELIPEGIFGIPNHCRITFHEHITGAPSIMMDVSYDGFEILAEDEDDTLPRMLVSTFFSSAKSFCNYLPFIDGIALSDGRVYAMRWSNPNDIFEGIAWEKMSPSATPGAEATATSAA